MSALECRHGHAWTRENTYTFTVNGKERRACRACKKGKKRASRAKGAVTFTRADKGVVAAALVLLVQKIERRILLRVNSILERRADCNAMAGDLERAAGLEQTQVVLAADAVEVAIQDEIETLTRRRR